MKKIFVFIPWAIVLLNVTGVALNYNQLPETIPSHFNLQGEVDGYGDKSTIFILLVLHLGITALLNWVGNHPEQHNYPIAITDENRAQQYKLSSLLVQRLNVIIGLLFTTITLSVMFPNFPTEIMLLELGLIFLELILHFRRIRKSK